MDEEAKADTNCMNSSSSTTAAPEETIESATTIAAAIDDEGAPVFSASSSASISLSPSSSSSSSSSSSASSTSSSSTSSMSAAETEIDGSPTKKPKFGKRIQLPIPIKQIVSLDELRQRFADSAAPPKEIEVIVDSPDSKRKTVKKLKHSPNEFYTFCTCPQCLEYREVILQLMDDQMKTRSTWEILQATLKKAYQPILKNTLSQKKYEEFLERDKSPWRTTGDMNHAKAQHLNFICDLSLTENMVSVLLSALLLVDDPHQLFELMNFQIECVVKAYWEGFAEIAKIQDKKIPAEDMLSYVLDGYEELCAVSESISRFLFAFENHHLNKFCLTWTMLNKRMYQQYVYLNVTDTMLACIITLKEDELTKKRSILIKKYIQFDDEMIQIDRTWKDTWVALNLYNLSEDERNRRMRLKAIHNLFDVIRKDVTATCTQCVDISEWSTNENRQLVWQSMLAFVAKSSVESFSGHINTLVCDDKCKECNEMLEYHIGSCKCVTCAIAGGPLPPKRSPNSTCVKCLTLSRAEKDGTLYESKILNVCASDDLFAYKTKDKRRTNSIEDLSDASSLKDEVFNEPEELYEYHLSWAVFKHLRDRKPFHYSKIEEKYFCVNCKLPSCLLARKILNNELALALSWHLIDHYQPLLMTHEDLNIMLKNIMVYNQKVVTSKIGLDPKLDDEVFKIYWSFAVSVIACYFIDYDDDSYLNLDYFELANNDIQLLTSRIKGAEQDGKFFQFLDKISVLALAEMDLKDKNSRTFEIKHNVAQYLRRDTSKLTHNTEEVRTPESEPPEPVTPTESLPPKKCGKDKTKKCCFDHADMSDHCKENHSSKKRIKKECNHARMNETRDRLRKKLSQLVNARKNVKAPILRPPHQQPHCSKTLTPPDLEEPSLGGDLKMDEDDDSLECLSTLCKRITHQPNKQAAQNVPTTTTTTTTTTKKVPLTPQQQQQLQSQLAQSQHNSTAIDAQGTAAVAVATPPPPPPPLAQAAAAKKRSNSNQGVSPSKSTSQSGRQRANEFFALLENLPEVSVKKWVNETLSFIEGSNETKGPVNEKKAAKKAKQKQRREEMKRIAELQDLRAQFHNIYLREFTSKNELRFMKACKKKDKKKISEYEANVKKLNRAKANVETNILELIATVKQTNADFKFSYLPTKEQQIEKLQMIAKEIITANNNSPVQSKATAVVSAATASNSSSPANISNPAATAAAAAAVLSQQENNLNGGAFYSIPYANANNFPPFVMPNLVASQNVQMCYAPNQPTDMSDPSKRIVTIRRVNLPNVPEPQVTVTAKGSSPDKDKLLYTFVNGQIVQTSQQQQQTSVPRKAPSPPQAPITTAPSNVVEKTKTQLKKERKRAKKQAELEQEQARLAREEELKRAEELKREEELKRQEEELKRLEEEIKKSAESSKTNSKKANKKKQAKTAAATATAATADKVPTSNTNANSKPKTKTTPAPSVTTSSSQATTRENSVCSQKVKPKPIVQLREKPPESVSEVNSSVERRDKEKRQKFIDNGQFDNNQFKMLHLDDFVSSDSADSDAETTADEVIEGKKETISVPPPAVQKAKTFVEPSLPPPPPPANSTATTNANAINIPQTKKSTESKAKPAKQQSSQAQAQSQQQKQMQRNASVEKSLKENQQQKQAPSSSASSNATNSRRGENRDRNNRMTKSNQAASSSSAAQERTTNDRNRNSKPSNNSAPSGAGTNNRRLSQAHLQQYPAGATTHQQQQKPSTADKQLGEKPKRSRKSKNKSQSSIGGKYASTAPAPSSTSSSIAGQNQSAGGSNKSRRNQSVIHSNSGTGRMMMDSSLNQAMQNLRLTSNNYPQLPPQEQQLNHHHHNQQQQQERHHQLYSQQLASNVSIMDQLNRGVQVENLSLPPGITLTKVDPSKSEQLRAKSESIKRLSKPLSSNQVQQGSNLHASQPTILTPGFFPHMSTFGGADQSGVIMVEAMGASSKPPPANDGPKVSKNRKRRNKKKSSSDNFKAGASAAGASSTGQNRNDGHSASSSLAGGPPKMVTLRNPMFGNMMSQNSPPLMPITGRAIPTLPMDQPASIIKNENGMFTIRNPALQAAVANGMPVSNYRQFAGNYYTPPQENVAPSAANLGNPNLGSSAFSYFSNNNTGGGGSSSGASGNVRSSSQPLADDPFAINSNGYGCDLGAELRGSGGGVGKCISAIGSEIKTAQQMKQRSKDSQWQNYAAQESGPVVGSQDNACGYSTLQSNYYNGYDVFSSSSNGSQQLSSSGSLFENSDCPLHHNCEDSPPPTITGFNHYLDGIPNTGIIRYDDASFLKTLMPGQNLNNEVSIHNVNDSNFARNATSPVAHRVEITPVYGVAPGGGGAGSRSSANLFNSGCPPNASQYSPTKGFATQPTHLGPAEFTGDRDVESFKRFSYDFDPPKEKQKVNININDLFMKASRSGNSSRSSPYLDDPTLALDGFVQNLAALKLTTDEQCPSVNGSLNAGTSPNGWW